MCMWHEEKNPSDFCGDESMIDTESVDSKYSQEQNLRGIEQDRFELLSAYLDGEVTPAERKQVQEWLETDPQVQQLYNRLLKLRYNIQNMEITGIQKSTDRLCQRVFQKIDGSRRKRRGLLWGGGAIAAIVLGSLTGLFSENGVPGWQIANFISPEEDTELAIALNRPAIDMTYQPTKIDGESLMLPLNRPPVSIPPEAMLGR